MDGHPFPLDIGSFGPDRFFTYVAAFGIFTDVPYETPQEDKRIWGRLAYIMNGAGALGRLKPTHVRVSYDDHQEEADVLVGLVTSTTSVGGFKTTRDLGISATFGVRHFAIIRATHSGVRNCPLRVFEAPICSSTMPRNSVREYSNASATTANALQIF